MEQDRGREAEAPWQIPARGWADILRLPGTPAANRCGSADADPTDEH